MAIPKVCPTAPDTTTTAMTRNQAVTCRLGSILTTVPMALEIPRATDTIALTPTSTGKNLGPVLGPGVLLCPSPIAGGIRTIMPAGTTGGISLSLTLTSPVPRTGPNLTTSGIGTDTRIKGDSRFSPLGRKNSLLSSFSSYEEYLDYFNRSGTSNQGSYHTSHDMDSFSDTLRRWGRSYKELQSLPRIPRSNKDSPTPRASSPSAALGAPPKGSPNFFETGPTVLKLSWTGVLFPCWIPRSKLQRKKRRR